MDAAGGLRWSLWLPPLAFASGFAGLGYEMVWTRMLAVSLGHEIIAVLAVLAAFFVGLAAGSFLLGTRILRSAAPERWYALLETVIGLWAIALVWLLPAANTAIPGFMGEAPAAAWHWLVAFSATLLLLLPATAAMGATLPALERIYVKALGAGRHLGGVYAANTLGAVAGTILATFLLAPALGYTATLWLCAAINFLCAAGMLGLLRDLPVGPLAASVRATTGPASSTRRLLMILLATGFLGLSYEVLVIRVLSQVLEDTVYTFALVLSTYLLGTALGAGAYQSWLALRATRETLPQLLISTACATLLGLAVLWGADATYRWLSLHLSTGDSSALLVELALAATVFLLPTAAMGALFSHLAQSVSETIGVGRAFAVNTLGAAFAPLLSGVLLLPAIGAKWALLLVSAGYLLLLPKQRSYATLIPIILAGGLAFMPALRFVSVPPGGDLVDYREGVIASVAVVTDGAGQRHMKVNNRFAMGSTSSAFADHRQTHLPLLLHPDPSNALFLGVGTGMSLDAARYHPELEVTAVELLPEALELMYHFETAPTQQRWPTAPRLIAADARRFAVASDRRYDVIIADLFHPSRDGAGSLYTLEHFRAVRERLTGGGLFCQWLPLFQMDLTTLRLITATFLEAFPHVQLHVPHYSLHQPIVGLIGSREPLRLDAGWLLKRVQDEALQEQLVALRLNSELAFLGGFLGGRAALESWSNGSELNRDDHPLVTYQAPAFAYEAREAQAGGHGRRLVELTEALSADRGTLLMTPASLPEAEFAEALERYWRARDAYLRAGLGVRRTDDLATMLAKTRDPLLEVLRISPEFDPAYRPLLAMAQALQGRDPDAARSLLRALNDAAPTRPEAQRLLALLSPDGSR